MVPMKNKRRNLQIDNKEQMVFMLVNLSCININGLLSELYVHL
jgi:hypothetical protein